MAKKNMKPIKVYLPKETVEDIDWLVDNNYTSSHSEIIRTATVSYVTDFAKGVWDKELSKDAYQKIRKKGRK